MTNKIQSIFDYTKLKYGGSSSIEDRVSVMRFPLKEEDILSLKIVDGKWNFDVLLYSRNVYRGAQSYKKAGAILEFMSKKWNEVFGEYPNSI